MRPHPRAFLSLFSATLLGASALFSALGSERHLEQCRHQESAPPAPTSAIESSKYLKYTPDKRFEIQHLALDITPDFAKRTIQGEVVLKFKVIGTPLDEIRLNAVDLRVLSAGSSEKSFKHQTTHEEIIFTFSPPLATGHEGFLTVQYTAEPARGVYFRTREMGYGATQLWTQGESVESRHWFPCVDHPLAKLTSEVTCHLPAGMVALSNGRQVSAKPDGKGLTAFHWIQEKPHANYLIALVAGELEKVEEMHRDVPLEFWTTPQELPQARNSLRTTKHAMEFFEAETGVPYPWVKYAQVAIQDFHWGGMENTSLTTLNDRTLYTADTENLFESNSLVAHELAHQWFGDLVTCKEWSHTWLNEGFATYYDWLWQGAFGGPNETLAALYGAAKGILSNTNETRGIVWRKYTNPGEMFNYLAYPKGAWVLHMLRSQLGPDLYRKAIHRYLERHAFGSVTTDDLRVVVEEISGKSFERFFDQWLLGIGAPALDVNYSWDEKTSFAKITVKQTQKITEDAPLFQFPLTLQCWSKDASVEETVQVREKEEVFYISLKKAPTSVRIDPHLSLLAKVIFKPTRPMLFADLADNQSIVAQHRALDQLSEKPDKEAVEKIRSALQSAEHYSVRIRAAEVLQQAHSEEALAALKEARSQSDSRVRNAVFKALAGFYDAGALQLLQQCIATEKNPGVSATALRGLAAYQTSEVRSLLAKYLLTSSYKERLATGALGAIKAQEDPAMLEPLFEFLTRRSQELPSTTLSLGLETVGTLSRHSIRKDTGRELLLSYLNHPREQVRIAALSGLGNSEDPRAVAVLETYVNISEHKSEKAAAEKALEKIRSAQKPNEELKAVRTEISTLRDLNRELKKDVETLRKKFEAKP